MTSAVFLRWVTKLFAGEHRKLLVVDLYKAHRTEEVLVSLRKSTTDVVFVPAGCTSKVQVMDVVVNKGFRDHVRKEYAAWRVQCIGNGDRIQSPSRKDVINWIKEAWNGVGGGMLHEAMMKYIMKYGDAAEAVIDNEQPEIEQNDEPEGLAEALDALQMGDEPLVVEEEGEFFEGD